MKSDVLGKLCKDFKVDEETCERFERFYNNEVESKLKLKYLSHLVSTIEEMINSIYKEKYFRPVLNTVLNSDQYTIEQKRMFMRQNFRLYSIVLRQDKNLNKKGVVYHHNYGSLIIYNPERIASDERDIRILLAHELGHIINVHVFHCPDTQNKANVFCFFAINGKDMFYKNKSKHYTYTSELAIIDDIFKVCPISKHNQT